jgi:hypothetical protein
VIVAGCVPQVDDDEIDNQPGPAEGSTETSEQTALTASGYLERIAAIYCDQSFACRAEFPEQSEFEAQWGVTIEACRKELLAEWQPAAIETEIAKGRVAYDGAAAVACLETVAFASCTEYWQRGIEWADACYHVMVGQVETGGLCDTEYACTSNECDLATHRCL